MRLIGSRYLTAALIVGGLVLGALSWNRFFMRTPAAPVPVLSASAPDTSTKVSIPPPSIRSVVESAPQAQAARAVEPLPSGEAARTAITELAITYDAAAVPELARFLTHPDPEIRTAAREGLISLGERAAIPWLKDAARTAPAEEAIALKQAAEFLALPSLTERRLQGSGS